MCLQTNWKEPKVAEKDILVYKLFEKGNEKIVQSPYNYFNYTINKLYKTKIEETDDTSSFDEVAQMYLKNISRNGVKSIGRGFHSIKSKKRVIDSGETEYICLKCIIPKGSLYYRGFTDLLVSNQIIITNKQVKI